MMPTLPTFGSSSIGLTAHKLMVCLPSPRELVLLVALVMAGLVGVLPADATTYYVASSGSDTNSGTDSGHPWQTVAKINGSTFSPGDSILFNRGNVWYGTSLTVPSSGSSGSPITFGAYGSGANPIIKASTLLSTSGYTLAPNSSSTIFSLADSGSAWPGGTANWREQVGHQDITASATTIAITVKAPAAGSLNITGSGIGPAATVPNASSITRITWGGNNGTTVAAGTSATSDWITYSLNNTSDQMVTIYTTAGNAELYSNDYEHLYSNYSGPDQSQSASVTGYSAGGNCVIESITSLITTQYTYRSALGSTPTAAWENDALLTAETSSGAVESNAGSWYYDGTYMYIHASDGSNVSTNGKTYTYTTSASPTYTTWDNAKAWLIFDSVDQAESYNTNSATLGGLYLTGSNSIVRNLAAHDTYRHGLAVYVGATNNVVTNVTLYNSYGSSPFAFYGAGTTGNLLQNSTLYNNVAMPPGGFAIVVAHGGSTGNTVDSCLIYSTATSPGTFSSGVTTYDATTTVTISHNLIYGVFLNAIQVGTEGAGNAITVFDNLIDESQASGTAISLIGSAGSLVYNNTIYGPANTNAAISQTSSSTGALVKNNIFWTGAYATVDASSETGSAYDYNDYYSASGTPFSWGGTAYTFANWKTSSSQDAHSLNSNPDLANGPGRTFTLGSGSPAIDAGTNLGTTYQQALSPSSSWPSGVSFLNQNSVGTGWEIGAYVFQLGRSTLLLKGCCDYVFVSLETAAMFLVARASACVPFF